MEPPQTYPWLTEQPDRSGSAEREKHLPALESSVRLKDAG
jgi:hypothetical protein